MFVKKKGRFKHEFLNLMFFKILKVLLKEGIK